MHSNPPAHQPVKSKRGQIQTNPVELLWQHRVTCLHGESWHLPVWKHTHQACSITVSIISPIDGLTNWDSAGAVLADRAGGEMYRCKEVLPSGVSWEDNVTNYASKEFWVWTAGGSALACKERFNPSILRLTNPKNQKRKTYSRS